MDITEDTDAPDRMIGKNTSISIFIPVLNKLASHSTCFFPPSLNMEKFFHY
jgi:hypothetical protein